MSKTVVDKKADLLALKEENIAQLKNMIMLLKKEKELLLTALETAIKKNERPSLSKKPSFFTPRIFAPNNKTVKKNKERGWKI